MGEDVRPRGCGLCVAFLYLLPNLRLINFINPPSRLDNGSDYMLFKVRDCRCDHSSSTLSPMCSLSTRHVSKGFTRLPSTTLGS